ncbi:KR domain-containing protein, partial [Streptomyces sp. NPDC020845]|uniref:SDR family NAD(P)-dependent oxidoreductase n=1 Tax=Streptomyces sp. NPDC020845 TaxID=3365096 RepID=UPI0037B7C3CF
PQTQHPRRIPLPTYPFQHQHHWLPHPTKTTTATTARKDTAERRSDLADWFHVPSWQRVALPIALPDASRQWLVFADSPGVGATVSARLRDTGARVTMVYAGDFWAAPESGPWTIDAREGSDYGRLLSALREQNGAVPTCFVHAWSVTSDDEDAAHSEEDTRRLGFESLVHLAQALSREESVGSVRLWVLSNGLHNVTGDERLSPTKATLLGPCRVLPREMAGLSCRAVDLDYAGPPAPHQLDRLIGELAAEPGQDTEVVAHRGIHRWTQHYLPQRLPKPARPAEALRPGGVYLITGGTGGLGLAVAGHLATAGARLALTARTPLPPAEEWDDWLAARPTDTRTTDAVRRLVRLRDNGAELLVVQADAGDPKTMRAAVEQVRSKWGTIHGVFHTAGLAGGGLIQLKDLRVAAEVLHPKVRGTLVLEEALSGLDLDFLVLFGSNAANIGSVGQVDYCAANCFLDAFAQDRGRHRRMLTIDWGPWRGVGMAADQETANALDPSGSAADRGMSEEEGLRALDTVLTGAATPQIVVSPVALSQLLAQTFRLEHGGGSPIREGADGTTPPGPATALPDMSGDLTRSRSDAEREICGIWGELLGVERAGTHDNFFELGGNSLIAIQLISVINSRLSVKLTLADLYEAPTVAGLMDLLEVSHQQHTDSTDAEGLKERRKKMQRRRQQQERRRTARGNG